MPACLFLVLNWSKLGETVLLGYEGVWLLIIFSFPLLALLCLALLSFSRKIYPKRCRFLRCLLLGLLEQEKPCWQYKQESNICKREELKKLLLHDPPFQ